VHYTQMQQKQPYEHVSVRYVKKALENLHFIGLPCISWDNEWSERTTQACTKHRLFLRIWKLVMLIQ